MRPPSDTAKRPAADTTRGAIPAGVIPFLPLPRAPDDTTHADSARAPAKAIVRDSIKTPIVRPFEPRTFDVGGDSWHWDRDAMFASSALTLGELLANVPGVTLYATGFVLAPQAAAWYGNPGSLRLFVDGVALDPVSARNGGITDLSTIPIWALEDVRVERAAGELRVYMRTWRVDRTTASTRTDVMTGSENLNFYRGFFGKRFDNGLAFQAAAQQLSTLSRTGSDGDALSAFGRLGWAHGAWSIDATLLRQGVTRGPGDRYVNTATPITAAMPALTGAQSMAYARAGWRDPQQEGAWAQLIAASISGGGHDSTAGRLSAGLGGIAAPGTAAAVIDSTNSRAEYTVAAGFNRGGLRLSTINRLRSMDGQTMFIPGGRVEYEWKILAVGAAYDRSADASVYTIASVDTTVHTDSAGIKTTVIDTTRRGRAPETAHTDLFARLAPWRWLQLGAAWSRVAPQESSNIQPTITTRLEAAVQWRNRWFSVGSIRRGLTALTPPIELDTALRAVLDAKVTGITVGFRGPLWFGWGLDMQAVRWNTASAYRPQSELRTTLKFSSAFLNKFPRNNFHLLVSGTHEYRGTYFIPSGPDYLTSPQPGYSVLSGLLEVRIGDATVTYQVRNAIGVVYAAYPGYVMPRIVNLYGVRWSFWN